MRKQRYHQDRINHDRWLISYADLITLLFAFFVVMYALSSLNESKYRTLSHSVGNAFTGVAQQKTATPASKQPVSSQITSASSSQPPTLSSPEREKMTGLAEHVSHALAHFIQEGKVHVVETSRGISIDISDSVLFSSGEADLTTQSSEALLAIIPLLREDNHHIQVEGYTDNQPIKNQLFPSNWELSAMRASSVVRLFAEQGIDEARLTAIGQGPKMPVGDNSTLDGRAKNRRVNITILSMLPEVKKTLPIKEEKV